MSLNSTLKQMTKESALLSIQDAATALGLTPWWVRKLVANGELRAINVGHTGTHARYRIDPEDLAAFLASRETRARDLVAS